MNTVKWTEVLVCPLCRGRLEAVDEGLACRPCKRLFPIVEGVPRLAPEESRRL